MNETGRFLAYVLRHNPASVGIKLDDGGWADVDGLIAGIRNTGREINKKILEEIVKTDDKTRFSFNADKSKIRANQGHSVNVNPELEEKAPPEVLYHGTAKRFLESIKERGITRQTRNYVHLSMDEMTAEKVGARHGEPAVLKIDARKMYADGYKFFVSANDVWLTEFVPIEYVKIL